MDPGIFLRIFFDIARSGIFPHLGPRQIFTKILWRMYLQSRKTLLSLGSHPDSRSELRILTNPFWQRSVLSECVFFTLICTWRQFLFIMRLNY